PSLRAVPRNWNGSEELLAHCCSIISGRLGSETCSGRRARGNPDVALLRAIRAKREVELAFVGRHPGRECAAAAAGAGEQYRRMRTKTSGRSRPGGDLHLPHRTIE